jgi:hypothetical protein
VWGQTKNKKKPGFLKKFCFFGFFAGAGGPPPHGEKTPWGLNAGGMKYLLNAIGMQYL